MNDEGSGALKASLSEMPAVKDRLTFIYLEKCRISRQDSAVKAMNEKGYVLIPSHTLMVLMLGPGTTITHRATELIADSGMTVVWTGEAGIKYYCSGRALNRSSTLLCQQAKCVTVPKLHMQVVKKMYSLRYPDEDLTGLTLQQLRGKEGSRVRKEYSKQAKKWNIQWSGRNYDSNDYFDSDPVNQSLSTANACLYGLVYAVVAALGLSPGLGFIHVGNERSFLYDIADLYKAEFTIPLAFQIAAESSEHVPSRTRHAIRDKFYHSDLLERIVKDIKYVLSLDETDTDLFDENPLFIWDGMRESKEARIQFFEHSDIEV